MVGIREQIEKTREKLNKLIAAKEVITNDDEILYISEELDKLINQYYNCKQ